MSWAEVKHALNNTLGTESFLPLDEIILKKQYESKVEMVKSFNTLTGGNDNNIISIPWGTEKASGYTNQNIASICLMPETVKVIDDECFYACSQLKRVFIPERVSTIGESAFSLSGLSGDLSIPKSVATIGVSAFAQTDITTLYLNNASVTIYDDAFVSCFYISRIFFAGTLERWDSIYANKFLASNYTVYCTDGERFYNNVSGDD